MEKRILMEELLQTLEKELQKAGMAQGTIANYGYYGIRPFRKHYSEAGVKHYDPEFNERIVCETETESAAGIVSPNRRWGVRKVSAMLKELVEHGSTTPGGRICTGSKTELKTAYYQDVLSRYVAFEASLNLRKPATIEGDRILIRHFLAYLESVSCPTLGATTLAKTNDFLTSFSLTNPGSVGEMIGTLKRLCSFAMGNGVACMDFRPALISRPSPRRKLRPTLTKAQADGMVNSINTDTPLGKRDYAMMMVAKWLGVRAGDILNLKFSDICWESHEITFRQGKTGVDVSLPLPAVVGNAIADYILNGRPASNDRHIFVRHLAPVIKLDNASNIFRRYDSHGVFERGSGFHSFRRGVASRMLNAGVAPDTVKGVMGHLKMDSLKPYARISDVRLSSCAIGLQNMETTQEELC